MSDSKEPPSPSPCLLIERRDACALVTLNRPEKLNALDRRLRADLTAAMAELGRDDSVRTVVLTGAGRAFCAGMDLKEFGEPSPERQEEPAVSDLTVYQTLEAMPKPVIAAINGFAVTGGFEIALACDILIASHNARFADTHAAVELMPGAGLSQKLSRIVGLPRAMALSLTGDYISAEQAYQFGLVSHLVEPEALLPLAWEMAGRIAEMDPKVAQSLKALIRQGAMETLGQGLSREAAANRDWNQQGRRGQASRRKDTVMQRGRNQTT